ncbi:9314_t:CDS:2, partial [Acaulospora colombiana]
MDSVETSDNSNSATPNLKVNSSDGLGPDIVVSSPVTQSPRRTIYISAALIKKQLQDQLNENVLQIEKTANLGNALVRQKNELEERIKELDKTEDDEVPQDLKDRIAALEQDAKALNANTAEILVGSKGLALGGSDINSPGSSVSTPTSEPSSTPTSTLKGKSRYENKKGKPPKRDIELAAEIGHGLLQEVKRLTILLQEKEEGIKKLEIDKAELERVIEILTKQVRSKEEAEAQLKDANWNLELMRQDLTNQLEDLQQQLNRARNDYTKIEKALATATDVIEQLKDKEEKLITNLENLSNRHEKDMANNRRHVTALNREKNDLLKAVGDLKAQLDSVAATRNIRKRTPEPGAEPSVGDGEPSSNLETSGIPAALQGKNLSLEETLKALSVAYRMIGSLRANLQKEKSEKYEVKKLLSDSQEQIEMMRYELDDLSAMNQKKLSGIGNGHSDILVNEDSQSGDDDIIAVEEGDEETFIDKNNRPSSDILTSSKVNRSPSTRSSKSPRMSAISQNIEIEEFIDSNSNNRESVVSARGGLKDGDYEIIENQKSSQGEDEQDESTPHPEIDDDASSVNSFESAIETNADSKRGSASSRRDSNIPTSKRSSKRDTPQLHKKDSTKTANVLTSEESNIPNKTFRNVEVQTDPMAARSDSLSTIYTGKFTFGNRDTIFDMQGSNNDDQNTRQSILLSPDDNNVDIKRFTLDLSSQSGQQRDIHNQQGQPLKNNETEGSHFNNQQDRNGVPQNSDKPTDQVSGLAPPPRPSIGPPSSINTQRPASVDFGQQAGSPKISQFLNSIPGQKGSDSLRDNTLYSNGSRSRGINNGTEVSHHHTPSSGSVSTASSASTSADVAGRRSDSSHQEIGGPATGTTGTDPNIIHAITQTMIGEYLWKYTRRNFGGISEKRHKRFFWVHPYTKTLYWSNKDPGSYEPTDPKSKSGMSYFAYIEAVDQVVDHNPSPPGIYHMSLVIKTPERELKFTAPSKERHDYWYQALSYLLQRHDETGQVGQGQTAGRPSKTGSDPWDNQSHSHNLHTSTSPNGSLKGNNVREVKKKSSFSKLQSMFRRQDASSSLPNSPLSSEFVDGQPQQLVVPSSSQGELDDEDEDLENVRQCCDGKHDVSKLEK